MPTLMNARAAALAAMAVLVLSCISPGAALAADQPMLLPSDPAPLVAETNKGREEFSIEIADDDKERAAGLMFRKSMSDRHGMLFVFPEREHLAFWMKNTPMPLDLVFVSGMGKVVAVLPGEPFSTDTISPREPAQFVLELKAGTAKNAGIEKGVQLRHPVIEGVSAKQ